MTPIRAIIAWPPPAAQHQRFDRRLPFRQVGFLLRQLHNVIGGVFEREKLATVRQWYRFLEFALPALVSHVS
jgi:hypothetical protein